METKILKKIVFDEKEIQVYLALLKTGNTTASVISRETDIDRATCYRYLDSLINKGLISYSIQNNVKYFQAANPNKILDDLKEKEKEYRELLPNLIELSNLPKEDFRVEVYKGKDGLKTVLREILRTKENHLVLGDEGHFSKIFPIFFEQFIEECKRKKIHEKVLCSNSVLNKIKKHDYKYCEIKSLELDSISPTTTVIYGNKVVLFNWELPYNALVISSKHMCKAYRNYFHVLWQMAKK